MEFLSCQEILSAKEEAVPEIEGNQVPASPSWLSANESLAAKSEDDGDCVAAEGELSYV